MYWESERADLNAPGDGLRFPEKGVNLLDDEYIIPRDSTRTTFDCNRPSRVVKSLPEGRKGSTREEGMGVEDNARFFQDLYALLDSS